LPHTWGPAGLAEEVALAPNRSPSASLAATPAAAAMALSAGVRELFADWPVRRDPYGFLTPQGTCETIVTMFTKTKGPGRVLA
jgi:hypothetical protein